MPGTEQGKEAKTPGPQRSQAEEGIRGINGTRNKYNKKRKLKT